MSEPTCPKCGKKMSAVAAGWYCIRDDYLIAYGTSEMPPVTSQRAEVKQYCAWCGSPIIPGASFCEYCGKRIRRQEPSFVPSPAKPQPERSIEKGERTEVLCCVCGKEVVPPDNLTPEQLTQIYCYDCHAKAKKALDAKRKEIERKQKALKAVEKERRLCKSCGTKVPYHSTFCEVCGRAVAGATPSAPSPTPPPSRAVVPRRPSKPEKPIGRSIYVLFAVFLIALAAITGVSVYYGSLQRPTAITTETTELTTTEPPYIPQVHLTNIRIEDSWHRGYDDLPETSSQVVFSLYEERGVTIEGEVTVTLDGELIYQQEYEGASAYDFWTETASPFDTIHSLTITAHTTGAETIQENVPWNPVFPRNPLRDRTHTLPLMVTPQETTVISTLEEIKQSKNWLQELLPEWMAILDWVDGNVQYDYRKIPDDNPDRPVDSPRYDSEIGRKWNFPFETITTERGVCRDFAILCCSLLRASGWSSDDVYVGVSETHAYVLLHVVPQLSSHYGWWVLEPQAGGLINAIDLGLFDEVEERFHTRYYFNDEGYLIGVPWSE